MGDATKLDLEAWDRDMKINVTSMVLMARHAIPEMVGLRFQSCWYSNADNARYAAEKERPRRNRQHVFSQWL